MMEDGPEKILVGNNGWQNFRFGENYKPIDPRSSVNSMQKKHKGNHLRAHYNIFCEKQW